MTALLETVTRTPLLGVRLWDAVSGAAPDEGVGVFDARTGIAALRSPSGVHVFHALPGVQPGTPRRFEIRDRERRYVELCFSATLPSAGPLAAMPVFSSPSRPVPPGLAAIRADLWDAAADAPAAGAMLEISGVGAAPRSGVAHEGGSVLVLAPYPEPRWQGSSPPAGSVSLSNQTWAVDVSVRYSPAANRPPDLTSVLTQPPATLLSSESPIEVLPSQTLVFGRELVLRSAGRSVLLVLPT